MADKRGSAFPAASAWSPTATFLQDDPAGITEKVTPAQVEAKLEADGFVKAASPSLGQVAAYTAGGWAPIKLADANIDDAAAIGWGKISKTGAVASDIGALPEIVVTGSVNFNSINSDLPCSAEISPSIVTNGPFGYAAPTKAHLLQSKGAANYLTQVLTTATAVAFRGMTSPGVWGSWRYVWDDANLPISALGLDLLNDLTAYSMRLTLGALASANPTATGTLTAPDVVVSNLAGAETRPAALDSTGKIVVGSANIRTFGTASASFTYSASTPSVVRTTGAIYVTLPAAADFSGSETVFFQEYVGGNSLGFTGQTFESSVSSGSWVTHASGYGWSVAWRKIILSCDGITWYVVVQ